MRPCSRNTVDHRHLDPLVLVEHVLEGRRLGDAQPHVQADQHQQRAGQERDAPAAAEELRVAHRLAQQQEDAAGQEEADRRAELREHAVPGALARRRVLGRQQHRAAPFAAQPEALAEAAQRQQQRRRRCRCWRRSAAGRSPRSTCPSSAAPPPASPCGRCGRRNGRTPPSRPAARRRRSRRWRATAASPRSASPGGKNSFGNTSTAAVA